MAWSALAGVVGVTIDATVMPLETGDARDWLTMLVEIGEGVLSADDD
jgi:hypothetical protein